MRTGTQRAGIIAVVLAALTMGLTFAHTLELPQKLGYDAVTWIRIQQSLYRYFGLVGGPVEGRRPSPPWSSRSGPAAAPAGAWRPSVPPVSSSPWRSGSR